MEALATATHARCGAQSPARRLTPPLLAAVCHAFWDPSSSSSSPPSTTTRLSDHGEGDTNGGGVAVVDVALGVRVRQVASGGETDSAKTHGDGYGDDGVAVVSSDVVCVSVCVPLLAVLSVKNLDRTKALEQEKAILSAPTVDRRSGCDTACDGWKLIGPHGDRIIKMSNSNGPGRGTFYFMPGDCDRGVPQGGADKPVVGPRFLLQENYRSVSYKCQAGTSKWWACCDTRELFLVDLCNKGRIAGHHLEYGLFVDQLFRSEVNPNELVVVVVNSYPHFFVFDVESSLKTENLTPVSSTNCCIFGVSQYLSAIMCMKNSGNRVFIVQYRDPADKTLEQSVIFNVEEETGFSKVVTDSVLKLCHLTQSLFCTLHRSSGTSTTTSHQGMCCRIWDCNDTSNPLRVIQDAVEGCVSIDATCGLLFVCTSNNQIKVVDALSGVALATLEVPPSFSLELTQVVGSASLHQSKSC
ncbi:hypothetical protein Pelo_1683 [Pelomyxa schiedti]|nr:hypothetical protein Pelo_1683 [Pelomyxa schiedti]